MTFYLEAFLVALAATFLATASFLDPLTDFFAFLLAFLLERLAALLAFLVALAALRLA